MANEQDARRRAEELLARESTVVLATAGEDGTPGAAALFYMPEGLNLYWLSSAESRHSRWLAARPDVAVAVYAVTTDWQAIRGVQMEGAARRIDDPAERERLLKPYRERFRLGPEFDPAVAASTLYGFQPRWLRYLDNSVGFGFRLEVNL